ncbi:MAG: hypothetical protein II697_07350 [Clostridia bacterium]|nr:hypothetical protein [Clostridia bacterium]
MMKKLGLFALIAALAVVAVLLFRHETPCELTASYSDGVLYYSARNVPGKAALSLSGVGALGKSVSGTASGTLRVALEDGDYTLTAEGEGAALSASFTVSGGKSVPKVNGTGKNDGKTVQESTPEPTLEPTAEPEPTATEAPLTLSAAYSAGSLLIDAQGPDISFLLDGEALMPEKMGEGRYGLSLPLSAGTHSLVAVSGQRQAETSFSVQALTFAAEYENGKLSVKIENLPGKAALFMDGEPTSDIFEADGEYDISLTAAHGAHSVRLDAGAQSAQAEIFVHSLVRTPALEPNCTQDGSSEDVRCSVCGLVLKEGQILPALGHDVVTLEAREVSCTEDGLTQGSVCARCGEVFVAQVVTPALGHEPVEDPAVSQSCTQPGKTAGSHCARCGEVLERQLDLPPLGHRSVYDDGVEPGCTQTGLSRSSRCTRCGKVIHEAEILPALGHEPTEMPPLAPSCTEAGSTGGVVCVRCGEILTKPEEVPPLGHEAERIASVPASCTLEGKSEGTRCARCGLTLEEPKALPALGHESAVIPAVPASCTLDGLTEGSYCARCGEILISQSVEKALGHLEELFGGLEASCEEEGLTQGVRCQRCGEVLKEESAIPALGHELVNDAPRAASCTGAGLTPGVHCQRCGLVLQKQVELPALGHRFDKWVTEEEPTCTASGRQSRVCQLCKTREERALAPLGHNALWRVEQAASAQETGLLSSRCARCGQQLETAVLSVLPSRRLSSATSAGIRIDAVRRKFASGDEWKMFSPIDLEREGPRAYPLVARGSYDAGLVSVNISEGVFTAELTVDERMQLYSSALILLPDLDSLTDFSESSYEFYSFPARIPLADLPDRRCVMLVLCKVSLSQNVDSYPLYSAKSDAHREMLDEMWRLINDK